VRVRERSAVLTQAELDAVMRPRAVTVQEVADGPNAFVAGEGMASGYRRTVTAEPLDDGRFRVQQRVELARSEHMGVWEGLFGRLLAGHLGRIGPDRKAPFWFPPDVLDVRAVSALARICSLAAMLGYAEILMSQTITYAAQEFGAHKAAQGAALAFARVDVVIALPLAILADRRGRRRLAINTAAAACAFSALGAVAPNLLGLTTTQVLARGAANACVAITTVMLAEEMPAGARAWAMGLVAMATTIGSGLCVAALPLADLAAGAWRILYLLPLVFLPLVYRTGRRLEETHRYLIQAANKVTTRTMLEVMRTHRARFALIAGSAALAAVFVTPAFQFQNEWLRTERGFSGAQITLFLTVTSIPGGFGIVVGGKLAENGRRAVGAIATFLGVAFTVVQFFSYGAWIYVWSALSTVIGAATVPALGVYGPELFPTEARSAANGAIGLVSRLGSVIGLLIAGALGDRIGLSRAFLYLSIGPAILTVLILVAYPETAHHTLEDLNPEDEPI
jgi:putative MFS transporter